MCTVFWLFASVSDPPGTPRVMTCAKFRQFGAAAKVCGREEPQAILPRLLSRLSGSSAPAAAAAAAPPRSMSSPPPAPPAGAAADSGHRGISMLELEQLFLQVWLRAKASGAPRLSSGAVAGPQGSLHWAVDLHHFSEAVEKVSMRMYCGGDLQPSAGVGHTQVPALSAAVHKFAMTHLVPTVETYGSKVMICFLCLCVSVSLCVPFNCTDTDLPPPRSPDARAMYNGAAVVHQLRHRMEKAKQSKASDARLLQSNTSQLTALFSAYRQPRSPATSPARRKHSSTAGHASSGPGAGAGAGSGAGPASGGLASPSNGAGRRTRLNSVLGALTESVGFVKPLSPTVVSPGGGLFASPPTRTSSEALSPTSKARLAEARKLQAERTKATAAILRKSSLSAMSDKDLVRHVRVVVAVVI